MNGGPSQLDLLDYKPKLAEHFDKELARHPCARPAHHDHDQRPGAVPGRAVEVQVRAARTMRQVGQRAAAAHRRSRGRHRADQDRPHQRHQPRPGLHVRHDRQRDAGQSRASARGSPTASAARTTTCRPSSCSRRSWSSKANAQALFTRMWSSGFLPTKLHRRRARGAGRSGALHQESAGVDRDDRRAMLDALDKLNERAFAALRRSGNPDAHRAIRDGLPHAGERAGADGHLAANRRRRSSCTART